MAQNREADQRKLDLTLPEPLSEFSRSKVEVPRAASPRDEPLVISASHGRNPERVHGIRWNRKGFSETAKSARRFFIVVRMRLPPDTAQVLPIVTRALFRKSAMRMRTSSEWKGSNPALTL